MAQLSPAASTFSLRALPSYTVNPRANEQLLDRAVVGRFGGRTPAGTFEQSNSLFTIHLSNIDISQEHNLPEYRQGSTVQGWVSLKATTDIVRGALKVCFQIQNYSSWTLSLYR